MASTYKVMGVFLTGSAHREEIVRLIVAEHRDAAIAALNSEAIRAGELLLSATATAVSRAPDA